MEHEKDLKIDGLAKPSTRDVGEVVDIDAAEVFLQENNFSHEYVHELLSDKASIRKLVRKIDLVLLPLMAGTYTLQYIDKQALSYAAVFDLFSDTNIDSNQYAWFASLFYFAYLVSEYPWSYLAQKTKMAKVVSGCVTTWGAILMITAACNNFAGLAVCRFLLGVFEAPITPCFMMIVGMWYTRSEQPFRAGVFYCCNGLGNSIGGILTYAIGQEKTFPVWKAIFLLCGGVTFLWGGVLLVFLPDDILSAKQFTLQDKAALVGRGKLSRTGILNHSIKLEQIKEALLDPQVWLLTLFMLLNEIINGGIANFSKLVLKSIVQDSLRTTALGIPTGAFQIFWILSGTYTASRFRNVRTIVMIVYLIPTMIATLLLWRLDRETQKIGVLIALYISGSYVTSLVIALQMPSANLGGYTKRITGTAMVFMAYCVGNIIGPHAFLENEQPIYPTGCKLIISCCVIQIFLAIALRVLAIWRNKKRDEAVGDAQIAAADDPVVDEISADQTDFENSHFRYVY